MPELPEVEISCREIEPWIKGYTILSVDVRNIYLRWNVEKEIINIRNSLVHSVQRRAKYLLFELDQGWIIVHLGMSGYFQILTQKKTPEKHDHIDLIISNGCIIRYTDPRRFGFWMWTKNLYDNKIISHLGIEPLSKQFNGSWMYDKLRNKRSTPIKIWLMNQKIIAGIGNIYANESLFAAGILPNRTTNLLSNKDTEILANKIKTILLYSINLGGTAFRNFVRPNGKKSYFKEKLKVYGRKNKPCLICNTIIKYIKYNYQRSSFFCPKCQY